MTLEERSNLVLALAGVLYANGQSTEHTVAEAERFGRSLGLRASIIPRWGELQLQAQDGEARIFSAVPANPTGVDMDRVASITRLIGDFDAGRLAPAAAREAISAISQDLEAARAAIAGPLTDDVAVGKALGEMIQIYLAPDGSGGSDD